jgi:hypothetical protein
VYQLAGVAIASSRSYDPHYVTVVTRGKLLEVTPAFLQAHLADIRRRLEKLARGIGDIAAGAELGWAHAGYGCESGLTAGRPYLRFTGGGLCRHLPRPVAPRQ